MSAYLEELLKERPYYSDLVTMAVDPGPRTNPDMLVTLRVPGNSYATTCLSPEQVYRAIAGRQSELAAKCKQQRDEWIDLMFKPRTASPPRVAAPPQVPGGGRAAQAQEKEGEKKRIKLPCRGPRVPPGGTPGCGGPRVPTWSLDA